MKWGQRQGMGNTVELGRGVPGASEGQIMERGCCTGGSSALLGKQEAGRSQRKLLGKGPPGHCQTLGNGRSQMMMG